MGSGYMGRVCWTRSLSAGEVGASVSRHSYITTYSCRPRFHGECNINHSSHSLWHLHPTNSTPMRPNYVLFISCGIADSRLDPGRIHSTPRACSPLRSLCIYTRWRRKYDSYYLINYVCTSTCTCIVQI